jgi:hypothetical protein
LDAETGSTRRNWGDHVDGSNVTPDVVVVRRGGVLSGSLKCIAGTACDSLHCGSLIQRRLYHGDHISYGGTILTCTHDLTSHGTSLSFSKNIFHVLADRLFATEVLSKM